MHISKIETSHPTLTEMWTKTKLIVSFLVASACITSGKYASIGDYQPQNDVAAYLALGEDLRAIDSALQEETDEGFQKALKIYQQGAYSDPFTLITVQDGLPFDISKGTTLTGVDNEGRHTIVTVAFSSYKAGASQIEIAFRGETPCRMSGIPVPELNGCLESDGELVVEGRPEKIRYSYTLTDIRNYHTIENLSRNAHSKFRPHGNTHATYFKDFQKQVDFFGSPDFADQIIKAAFNGGKYVGQHMALDFSQFSLRARRSIIVHTAAFSILGLFVIRELETALFNCDHRCGSSGCNAASIHSLDAAVALYTGALYQENGKGNLNYGLGEKMCGEFRTCGSDALKLKGPANVNIDIFKEFNAFQKDLDASHCHEAKMGKEAIAHQMSVPLLQATLLAIKLDAERDFMESRAERVVFSTSVLPLLFECDPVESLYVVEQANPLVTMAKSGFARTKSIFESNYRCMGVTCKDIGGIWDKDAGNYVEGAESCYQPDKSDIEEESGFVSMHLLAIVALAVAIFGVLSRYACKRRFAKQQRKQRSVYTDDYDSDSDDESVEMRHTMT